MALTKITANVNNHQTLADLPNSDNGLTSAQVKVLYDKAATDIKTYVNDVLTEELDVLYEQKYVVIGDGTTDKYTELNALLTTISTTPADIYFYTDAVVIASDITFPSNVVLHFSNGAMLKPSSGKVITGANTKIEAGLTQIFDLSAGGSLGGTWDIKEIYPQWLGAVGDGVADGTVAIQNANDIMTSGGILFFQPQATYLISDTINIDNNNIHIIIPTGAKILSTLTNKTLFNITGDNCSISGAGTIETPESWDCGTGSDPVDYAIIYADGENFKCSEITIENVNRYGIVVTKNKSIIDGVVINANMPFVSYDNPSHFGICLDTNNTYPLGKHIVKNCIISQCAQGVFGGGSFSENSAMATDNIFIDCFDHAVYFVGMDGSQINNNTAFNCGAGFTGSVGDYYQVNNNIVYFDGSGVNTNFGGAVSMRDVNYSNVSHNVVYSNEKADTIIDFRVIQTTVTTNNKCSHNVINVIDCGNGICFGVNTNDVATDVSNNLIHDNWIKTNINANIGLIRIFIGAGSEALNNKIYNNTIISLNAEDEIHHAILLTRNRYAEVFNNTMIYLANATTATYPRQVQLTATCQTVVKGNKFQCLAGYGEKASLVGVTEDANALNNEIINNVFEYETITATAKSYTSLNATSYKSRNRISSGFMSGQATILSGQSAIAVTNANILTSSRVMITPANAEAGAKGGYVTLIAGTFTITTVGGATGANAIYNYEIL